MFRALDAFMQALSVVVGMNRHDLLREDGPGVGARVDEVYGAARDVYAPGECLRGRVDAWKSGTERRVHVHHPVGKGVEQRRREHPHETREHHEVDVVRREDAENRALERRSVVAEAAVVDGLGRHTRRFGTLECVDPGAIGHHDLNVEGGALCGGVQDRLEVRSASAHEHTEAQRATEAGGRVP